jgi:hypothetical protein
MLRRVALVRIDVSQERINSIIRVIRISELGTTLTVFLRSLRRLLVKANAVPTKRQFLQEPQGVISQKTAFFVFMTVLIPALFETAAPSNLCRNLLPAIHASAVLEHDRCLYFFGTISRPKSSAAK